LLLEQEFWNIVKYSCFIIIVFTPFYQIHGLLLVPSSVTSRTCIGENCAFWDPIKILALVKGHSPVDSSVEIGRERYITPTFCLLPEMHMLYSRYDLCW
jgi:hypothetical protein